jgi:hypothetical protein
MTVFYCVVETRDTGLKHLKFTRRQIARAFERGVLQAGDRLALDGVEYVLKRDGDLRRQRSLKGTTRPSP